MMILQHNQRQRCDRGHIQDRLEITDLCPECGSDDFETYTPCLDCDEPATVEDYCEEHFRIVMNDCKGWTINGPVMDTYIDNIRRGAP